MATTNGEEIKRLDARVDSVESQLYSLVKTTHANTEKILQRLTGIERELQLRSQFVDKRLDEYSRQLKELTDLQNQAKGVTWTFKAAIGLIGALEAWHVAAGWISGSRK